MLKVVSIFLAFQVLLSSMSFNIGLHFCGESLKSLAFFGEAEPCEHSSRATEHSTIKECPFHSKEEQSEKDGCCNDKVVKVEGQDINSPVSFFNIDLTPHFEFLAAYTLSQTNLYQAETYPTKYLNYKPPLIQADISVLKQVFLI